MVDALTPGAMAMCDAEDATLQALVVNILVELSYATERLNKKMAEEQEGGEE